MSRFSKWQLVCENLSYKNELWILFQILSPCSTVKLLIIVEIFFSDLNFQKISIISEFPFFCNDHNDSCLSNLLLKAIFQIFTSTMPNFVVFDAPKLEFQTVLHSFVQLQTASYSCAKRQIVICWFNSVLIWSSKWKGACEKNHNDKSIFQIFLIYNLMFSNYLFQTFTTFNVTLVCDDNGLVLAKSLNL